MYQQIQSIPTLAMFLKRGALPDQIDYASGRYALDTFNNILPQQNTQSDSGVVAYSLQTMQVNGKQVLTVSETGADFYALQSFVNVTPQQNTQSDSGVASYSINSFVNVIPQTITQTESGVTNYALQSMIV